MFEGLCFLEASINEVNWLREPDLHVHKHAGYADQKYVIREPLRCQKSWKNQQRKAKIHHRNVSKLSDSLSLMYTLCSLWCTATHFIAIKYGNSQVRNSRHN